MMTEIRQTELTTLTIHDVIYDQIYFC